jgi:SpoVK/Ycf46/Vps4 family AAA+-type ATPase
MKQNYFYTKGDRTMHNIIIKNEQNYQVLSGNAISLLERLPPSIYELYFNPQRGFSLNKIDKDFNITEKLYGDVESIVNRVLNTFNISTGNLGVLFSGPKGLGKSLTSRAI